MNNERILFIYNADSTVAAKAMDFLHKIVSPETYQCNLCKITYGSFAMDPAWKKYIEDLPVEIRFLHRDEFEQSHAEFQTAYPVALHEKDGTLSEFISVDEIDGFTDLNGLMQTVKDKLKIG